LTSCSDSLSRTPSIGQDQADQPQRLRRCNGHGALATGTKVFVFPNTYEKGRANVAVFNWDGKDRVEADLSGARAQGQKYVVYNCLDIKQTIDRAKPVHEGVFRGEPITLPMRGNEDCPDFDAFLVLPL
jgi:hypothetical protein